MLKQQYKPKFSKKASRAGRHAFALAWLPEDTNRVLDVGCANGDVTAKFVTKATEVFGIDTNQVAIEMGRRLHPELTLILQTQTTLPFSDNFFDVVTLLDVIEHVGDENKALLIDEVTRVLKPEGLLLFTAPHAGLFGWLDPLDFKRRFKPIYQLYTRISGYQPETSPEIGHKHVSFSEIKRLFAGRYAIIEIDYSALVLYPLMDWCFGILTLLKLQPRWLWPVLWYLRNFEEKLSFGSASYSIHIVAQKL